MPTTTKQTSRQAARHYIARGWKPLPVKAGKKGPEIKGWPEWKVTDADDYIAEHFSNALPNVGVQLGEVSNGLTDVDLDSLEAVRLAPNFLPETKAIFGRDSKRAAHHLYVTGLYESESRATLQFKETKALSEKETMLVELRIGGGGKGAVTLMPPSTHPSGERITWDRDGDATEVDGDDLKRQVALLAAATLLVRHYPASGGRQSAFLVLGGVLARAGWNEDDIAWFVGVLTKAAKDEEANKRIEATKSAVARLKAGEDVPGLPRLGEEWTEEVAELFAKWIGYDANGAPGRRGGAEGTQTDQLIALADEAELFHSKEGVCFATVSANGHRETWLIGARGGGFAQWLRHQHYDATGSAPNSQSLTAALNTLAAKALYAGEVHDVNVRIAAVEQRIYLDLCDEDWRVIEIDANGWRLIADPPVRFLRRRGMLPLPMPVTLTPKTRSGAIDKLFNYVNVATAKDFCLLVSYLLSALSGHGPFVVLVILGEAGTAKSSLGRVLKALIDPNKAPLRAPPREARDLFIAANNSYLIAFDNLSELPGWLSDMLCRLSTGGGFGTRQLYTDEDEMLFDAMRPVVLTSIDNVIVRGDLTDRSIFLTLRPIPENERRHEKEFMTAFERDKPEILGALLDIVAVGLRELPTVKLKTLPRMADFALWATACERGAADALWNVGLFAKAYAMNRASATAAVIEDDLVANAIRELVAEEDWRGETAALLRDLNDIVDDRAREQKYWPKAPNALARKMNKVAGVLRKIGIEVKGGYTKKTNRRLWTITLRETSLNKGLA